MPSKAFDYIDVATVPSPSTTPARVDDALSQRSVQVYIAVFATCYTIKYITVVRRLAYDLKALELEFYTELQNYEVTVDAIPVDLSSQDPARVLSVSYMLQAGAFERRELAETEMRRQQALGLQVQVKAQNLVGRTLFLVQSGPYTTNGELDNAENILRRNNIPSLRMAVQ